MIEKYILQARIWMNDGTDGDRFRQIFLSDLIKIIILFYQARIGVNDGDHFGRIFLGDFSGHLDADSSTANDDHVRRFVDLKKKNLF